MDFSYFIKTARKKLPSSLRNVMVFNLADFYAKEFCVVFQKKLLTLCMQSFVYMVFGGVCVPPALEISTLCFVPEIWSSNKT